MSANATTTAGGRLAGRSTSAVSLGLVCGLFLAPTALGFSAAPVALPALAAALHVSAGSTAWVLASYSLSTAVMTALSGRIADLRGLRPPLALATGVLAAGTLLTLTGGTLALVIAGRLIQGAGAGAAGVIAFRLPAARLTTTAARGRAIGTLGLVVGLCSGAGALLGGALSQYASWRWALALPGLSLLAVPAVARNLPGRETTHEGTLDLRGAIFCTLAIAGLALLIQAHSTGLAWPSAAAAGMLVLAAGAALTRHQHHRPDGFLPHVLLANARFRLSAAAGFMLFAGYLIMQFAAPLLLLAHHRLSTTQVGLILLPAGLASAATSRTAGALLMRVGPWPIVITLASGSAAGLVLASVTGDSPIAIVLALAACVSGFSAGQVTLMAALPDIVNPEIQGIATGTFQLVFIIGGSVGAASVGALITVVSLHASLAILTAFPAAGVAFALIARRAAGVSDDIVRRDGSKGVNERSQA
jgi:MFS family permease